MDWEFAGKIAIVVLTILLTEISRQRFERRPRLIAYYSSVCAFPPLAAAPAPPAEPTYTFTHSIVIRNAGKRTAFNVRAGHFGGKVTFEVSPAVNHKVEENPHGGWEILIPTLVPYEQVQISYLYFPPTTVNSINSYIKSDEASARIIQILPTPPATPLARFVFVFFFYFGLGMAAYVLVTVLRLLYEFRKIVGG
jgi:hypothetical protein